ncbi:MAG: substrate-binding domain-containing protein [Kiritimatiellia bacterium]|nr:substrate-binding domain-containing protein [Kiritimatiellia bacterium]
MHLKARLRKPKTRRIAALIGDNSVTHHILDGLYRYALDRPDWLIWYGPLKIQEVKRSSFDALIGVFNTPESVREFSRMEIPLISVLGIPENEDLPAVIVDHLAVGRKAAEYFLSRNLSTFAFAGCLSRPLPKRKATPRRESDSVEKLRLQGFQEILAPLGKTVEIAPPYWPWDDTSRSRMVQWLKALPKPIGLFCFADQVARAISDLCRMEGLPVPEHIAILGVDNDVRNCEMALPALSSIAIPWELLGEELGHMLDALFQSGLPTPRRILMPPSGIVERASTSTSPATDPVVARALERLHEQAYGPGNLKEIFHGFELGRRHLDRRFHQATGRTLLTELWLLRVERARLLLQTSSLPLTKIALSSGFTDRRQMARVFLRITGNLPRQYRSAGRASPGLPPKLTS